MTEDDFRGAFDDATTWVDCFGKGHAEQIANEFVDTVIGALRRDIRWRVIPRLELELLLANARQRFAEDLADQFGGYSPGWELLDAAAEAAVKLARRKKKASAARNKSGGSPSHPTP
jgi:hypothetical protein